jgi:phospholipid/cholesterol/gamma-HCH transport system substrate-binding protein
MKRSISVRWGKLKVGILVMFAIAMAMWASLSGGGTSIFEPKNEFIAYFRNVNGLVTGSPVWMAGVEVGNVKSVEFVRIDTTSEVKVVCRIKESAWKMLTQGSEVALGTIGFLGDKYVEVYPGPVNTPVLPENSVVPTRNVGDAGTMFKAGEKAFNSAGAVVNNLDTLLARMNRGEGTLGKMATDKELYEQMTRLLADLTTLARGLQKNQERLTASIEKVANSTEGVAARVTGDSGSVGRMFNDKQLYDNLASATARLDSITMKLNSGKGSAGMLVNDTALYVQVTNLMERVNNLVTDIEKNPRKYFKFSVF